jgi:hypothetical protein
MVQTLDMFLTAYDPSDLPGGSVDPLGFDRGYTFLADSILPGMTNVASRPRYISVLCTGVFLGDNESEVSFSHKRENRRECALRLERLWAPANVLLKDAISMFLNDKPGFLQRATIVLGRIFSFQRKKEMLIK